MLQLVIEYRYKILQYRNKNIEVMLLYGIVRWFDNGKGYGFIFGQNTEDFFVHYSAIAQSGYKSLDQGDVVQFDTRYCRLGHQAINVRRIHAVNR